MSWHLNFLCFFVVRFWVEQMITIVSAIGHFKPCNLNVIHSSRQNKNKLTLRKKSIFDSSVVANAKIKQKKVIKNRRNYFKEEIKEIIKYQIAAFLINLVVEQVDTSKCEYCECISMAFASFNVDQCK